MPRSKGKTELQEYDQPQSLLLHTRQLIKEDRRQLKMISQATNVPFYWLKKFSAGEIPNPSVNRVQYLHDFLSQKDLLDGMV